MVKSKIKNCTLFWFLILLSFKSVCAGSLFIYASDSLIPKSTIISLLNAQKKVSYTAIKNAYCTSFLNIEDGYYKVSFIKNQELNTYFVAVFADSVSLVLNADLLNADTDLSVIEISTLSSNGLLNYNGIKDFKLYEGKKNDIIKLNVLTANKATNNARQIFGKVTGLHIWESDQGGLQLGLGSRGLNPSRTANFNVRQNGYDISADALGYPETYYTPPTEALESIEILRGASSLQYGSQFGGLINFKLKSAPTAIPLQVVSRQTYGSCNYFNSFNSVSGNVLKNKLSFYGFVNYKQGNGFRQNSKFNALYAFLNLKYQINKKVNLELEYTKMQYLAQQAGGLTDLLFKTNPKQSLRNRNWFNVNWNLAQFKWSYSFAKNLKMQNQLFGLFASRASVGNLDRLTIADLNQNRTLIKGTFINLGNEFKVAYTKTNFALITGIRLYKGNSTALQGIANNKTQATFTFLNNAEAQNSNYSYTNLNAAYFAEAIWQINAKLKLIPGFRTEYIMTNAKGYFNNIVLDAAGNVISSVKNNEILNKPRAFAIGGLGLTYTFNKKFNMYANISQCYRAINFSDMRIQNPSLIIDPNLKDEKGFSSDIGVSILSKTWLKADITAFYVKYIGKIGQILQSNIAPLYLDYRFRTNVANAYATGLEALVQAVLLQKNTYNWQFFINTTVLESKYLKSKNTAIANKEVEMVPPIIVRYGTDFRYKAFKFQIQHSLTQSHFSDATNTLKTASAVEGVIPAYQVVDLSLQYQFKSILIEASVNNLTNTNYFTRRAESYPGPGIIPADGRAFYVTLQVKL